MGSPTRDARGTAAWLRLGGLQGRLAQHERATRLERRALVGRLSHQFGTSDGLRPAACPVRPDGATAIPRTAVIVLLLLDVIPLALLFADLWPAHALLYTSTQQWSVRVVVAAGTLIPLGLMLFNGGLLLLLVAVIVLLAQSWLIRSVYVKILHTSPLEVRSGE
jgi:hypothetical protein